MKIEAVCKDIISRSKFEGFVFIKGVGDCVFFKDYMTVKIFRPKVKRGLGSQLVDGSLGFFLIDDRNGGWNGKIITKPPSLSTCPIMNFPNLVVVSSINDGLKSEFVSLLTSYLSAIPNNADQIEAMSDKGFLSLNAIERTVILANWLRLGSR